MTAVLVARVQHRLLWAQIFPLELVEDLVRVFPRCVLGQVYGKSPALIIGSPGLSYPICESHIGNPSAG